MPTPTYDLIASNVLSSSASSVTFSSIPATYRDLVLVIDADSTSEAQFIRCVINSDTGSNYTAVEAYGTGTATGSSSSPNAFVNLGYSVGTGRMQIKCQIMDYSATNKHKTALVRHDKPNQGPVMIINRWANTAAVTSLTISTSLSTFVSGSSFYLYGIAS